MSIYLCEKFHVWHSYAFDDLKYFIEYSSYLTLNKYTITFAMKPTSKRLVLNVFCIFLLFTNLLVQLWSLCVWNVTLKKKPQNLCLKHLWTNIYINIHEISQNIMQQTNRIFNHQLIYAYKRKEFCKKTDIFYLI